MPSRDLERRREREFLRRKNPRARFMRQVQDARRRARAVGLPGTITAADIPVPVFCPVLGIPLGQGKHCPQDNQMSLDRIRPELGYVPGNVRVISFRANTLKNNATIEELRAVLRDLEAPPLPS